VWNTGSDGGVREIGVPLGDDGKVCDMPSSGRKPSAYSDHGA